MALGAAAGLSGGTSLSTVDELNVAARFNTGGNSVGGLQFNRPSEFLPIAAAALIGFALAVLVAGPKRRRK